MRPEVAAAMAEAAQRCMDLAELQARASELLAGATGAEAGGRDGGVPDTAGMANEVVVARSQRNMYDRAVVQAGARLVEVVVALSPSAMAKASGLPPHPTPRHPTGMPKMGWSDRAGAERRQRSRRCCGGCNDRHPQTSSHPCLAKRTTRNFKPGHYAMVVNLRRRLRDYCARMPSCRSHSYYVGWRNAARTFRDKSSAKRA